MNNKRKSMVHLHLSLNQAPPESDESKSMVGFRNPDLQFGTTQKTGVLLEVRPAGLGHEELFSNTSGNQLDDEDEEVEAIKQQIKFAKQESLSSTRNALRIAREAEGTARNTMNRLGEQSDRLANTENHLDLAKAHAKGKRDAHEQKLTSRHEEEKAEDRRNLEGFRQGGPNQPKGALGGLRSRLADKARCQFENTESDDELEDELDNNLDEISGLTSRLMGTEIDSQNHHLALIEFVVLTYTALDTFGLVYRFRASFILSQLIVRRGKREWREAE
ncbi:uncharacterized protein PGTG_20079 [Puccinia graminis f. sp. tritici CRL 75-36-700-3]|uniref:t-SNARE coiled-coil homology domain-containing protein n=1 Tax=Puccinia graminis f. sp. tritici (strain CRL 75-36-700-3 / race SCCL) TaxID=418459 RepID=E3LC17_PUCGT|nr:uncharacterized protein PGTG_20079 [Puccinia graminis f. sp. tritici CRL 75-36-700-3]EFP94092.2 hypothetical protein PGTG_20079 [Puccinia graminis f. sp. tritici CRL 75-36-700-3]